MPSAAAAPYLSLHAADANELVQNEQSAVSSVVAIHAFFFGQRFIEAFFSLLKGLLSNSHGQR